MARPSKIKYYMDLSKQVATRSHDEETQVGMLLIKEDTGAIVEKFHPAFEEVKQMKDLKILVDTFESEGCQYYRLVFSPRGHSIPELKGAE